MKVTVEIKDKQATYSFDDLAIGDAIVCAEKSSTRVKINDHQFIIVWSDSGVIKFYFKCDWSVYQGDRGTLHKAEIKLKLTR